MTEQHHTIAPIGAQIRALRESRGLTLHELAAEVGTSAPTMHRYEGYWEGFTMRTLRRIAAALDADLEVRISPRKTHGIMPKRRARISFNELLAQLGNLFWDVEPTDLRIDEHGGWILTRVLNEGNLTQVRTALAFFDTELLHSVRERRDLTKRARAVLDVILEGAG